MWKGVWPLKNQFFAFISRMKYIRRWGLMRNTEPENLKEHCFSVAMIAHALGIINNVYFGGNADADRLAVLGLYHDAEETITGDMPTPVKYFSPVLRQAYGDVEEDAKKSLLSMLPEELRPTYDGVMTPESEDEKRLLKAADVIDAYIKCLEEMKCGNVEFKAAAQSTRKKLEKLNCPEADKFIKDYIPAYNASLDELQTERG